MRIAIAGNIIDHGVADAFDLEETLERVLRQPFAIDGLTALRTALATTDAVLYLGDNAGETVFDRVLIEHLVQRSKSVTYVVKASPIINDATREDALAAGLEDVAEVIDNGSAVPGIFFLLQAKCGVIARELGVAQGESVLKAPGKAWQVRASGS